MSLCGTNTLERRFFVRRLPWPIPRNRAHPALGRHLRRCSTTGARWCAVGKCPTGRVMLVVSDASKSAPAISSSDLIDHFGRRNGRTCCQPAAAAHRPEVTKTCCCAAFPVCKFWHMGPGLPLTMCLSSSTTLEQVRPDKQTRTHTKQFLHEALAAATAAPT